MTGPLALIILDGWGIRAERDQNAVALAEPATFLDLLKRYPSGTLEASGEAVGLPAGQMGNSEVGHTNLGAGRVVYQDLTRIDKSIREHDLETRPALLAAYDRCAGSSTHALHLIGLLSDGGVHSHQQHLHALIALAKARGVSRVFVHVLTDGRDTSPTGGRGYVAALEAAIAAAGVGRIASVSGRYWAMDRDKRWERTRLAYDTIVHGEGPSATSAGAVIEAAYADKVTDEFIKPHVVVGADGAARRPDPRRRLGGALQLPRRSHASDRAGAGVRGLRRLRSLARRRVAARRADDDDGVRPEVHVPDRLPAGSRRAATSPKCSPSTS